MSSAPEETGSGETTKVVDKSALLESTLVAAVAVLSLLLGSNVCEVADAVLLIVPVADGRTLATSVKLAVAPLGSGSLLVQETVPFSPASGVEQVKPVGART